MITKRIELPEKLVNHLVSLPENGMGYQIVKVFLENGSILHNLKVINSSVLIVDQNLKLNKHNIEKVELE